MQLILSQIGKPSLHNLKRIHKKPFYLGRDGQVKMHGVLICSHYDNDARREKYWSPTSHPYYPTRETNIVDKMNRINFLKVPEVDSFGQLEPTSEETPTEEQIQGPQPVPRTVESSKSLVNNSEAKTLSRQVNKPKKTPEQQF